jgi:hypothetical protein
MRYGFYLPTRGPLSEPDAIAKVVQAGEALGYATMVFADHIVFPTKVDSAYPYTVDGGFPGQGDTLEQLSLMAFVAGLSERARLVTSVMILPHRNPLVTAKALATIDILSKGRVTVGVGVGWMREEFEALNAPDFGSSRNAGPRTRSPMTARSIPSRSSAACRIRCRNRIRRSGSAVTAGPPFAGRRNTAMAGIRSARPRPRRCRRRNSSRCSTR